MRFKTVTDLNKYLVECESTHGSIDYIDVDIQHTATLIESVQPATSVVKITSLFDSPCIQHKESVNENEIYVNSYDAIENACGTGRIELLGRSVLLNICESENTVHVNLDIEVDGQTYNNVPFTVRLTEDQNCYILLNKNKL